MDGIKHTLRQSLLAARLTIPPNEATAKHRAITTRVLSLLDWSTVQTVHIYLPLTEKGEIDTELLIQRLQRQYPHIRIATWSDASRAPRAVWHDSRLTAEDRHFDVIIVPLLGYSSLGHRLGYGGGFYDRFLARQAAAVTIGLAYEMSHIAAFPQEAHDIPLSYIVTEIKATAH